LRPRGSGHPPGHLSGRGSWHSLVGALVWGTLDR
jgi:hypothetical protein